MKSGSECLQEMNGDHDESKINNESRIAASK
jgi:hypothetical protein